jgi:hypothetical protein
MVQINAKADHVVITSRNLKALEEALKELDNEAQETELIINQKKYAHRHIYTHTHTHENKLINKHTKMKIYKTLIRSVVTYANKTLTLSVQNINNLLVSERQILGKIFGPIRCREGWRI